MKRNKDDKFIQKIFSYYRDNGRHDLLWRKNITAYKVLVSEIMLQQTQVQRVTDKFSEWLVKYPNLTALEKAQFKDILVIWQGLGYQRRAKALYEIAKSVKHIPDNYEELLTLPGIGPYTASAVMAFAYDKFSYPVLETNIRTVLIEEFYKEESDIHDNQLMDDLARLAEHDVVIQYGARVWYYALMDYGAMLKENRVSHNKKSVHYSKQSPYKGSQRELRAKILFAIAHSKPLPEDKRNEEVISLLINEGYINKVGSSYQVTN